MSAKKRAAEGIRRERTPFEWALLVASSLATAAIVVGLAVSGLSQPDGPADLRLTVAEAGVEANGGRAYRVTVRNAGGHSAVNVVVEVTAGDVVREITLDRVADGDTETVTVVFPPGSTGTPEAEVAGFQEP